MKRLIVVVVPLLFTLLVVAMRPAEGQDNLQDRVSTLETQVAALQQQVGSSTVASAPTNTPTHTLRGSLTIFGDRTGSFPDIDVTGTRCEGDGGYSDFTAGGNITVRDGNGTIIASGTLDAGKLVTNGCEMPFSIANVPEVPFYSIEIGRRGGYSISLVELQAQRWTLELSIGG